MGYAGVVKVAMSAETYQTFQDLALFLGISRDDLMAVILDDYAKGMEKRRNDMQVAAQELRDTWTMASS